MPILKCNTMRRLVILSGLLFLIGIILQLLANLVGQEAGLTFTQILYTGFFITLSSPLLLLSTLVMVMLSSKAETISECEH